MKNIDLTYLVGNDNIKVIPLAPYSELACDFLNDLSAELRNNKANNVYPDVIAFAFWCRKSNILSLKEQFKDNNIRLGRGLVFHITPSNVPVNFAFSFAFGLIAGNANIVRVPSKPYAQVEIICGSIIRVLEKEKYGLIKRQTAFIRYSQNDELTAYFSSICQARIIWGGDFAIQSIRKFPLAERAVEIVFADRYSLCVINADAVQKLDDVGLKRLAEGFYNDTYLMDQNACSSPHLIIWQGHNKEEGKKRFWNAVYDSAQKYNLRAVNAVDKYTYLCHQAIQQDSIKRIRKYGNLVYCLELKELQGKVDNLRGKFGFFYEYDSDELNNISGIVNTRYQTLTYFGVDKTKLLDFVIDNHLSGIDRIVPIGSALDIGIVWDGYNTVEILSRVIELK